MGEGYLSNRKYFLQFRIAHCLPTGGETVAEPTHFGIARCLPIGGQTEAEPSPHFFPFSSPWACDGYGGPPCHLRASMVNVAEAGATA